MRLNENPTIEKPALKPIYDFAKKVHDETGAIRKHSGEPYFTHPSLVADIATAYEGTDEEIASALLHDTLEDTPTTYEEIATLYGESVADIVSEITNDKEYVQKIGKEQYINQELLDLDHAGLFVKLCDMYANMLDNPTPSQRNRMLKNLKHLIKYRGDDLTDKERRLLKSIPGLQGYVLDKPEFEDMFEEDFENILQ